MVNGAFLCIDSIQTDINREIGIVLIIISEVYRMNHIARIQVWKSKEKNYS